MTVLGEVSVPFKLIFRESRAWTAGSTIDKTEEKLSLDTLVWAPWHLQSSYCLPTTLQAIIKTYVSEGHLLSPCVSHRILCQLVTF